MDIDPLNSIAESVSPTFDISSATSLSRKLYAISDLHLSYKDNREALQAIKPHPSDSIILCGDIGETAEHLSLAFAAYKANFDQVWWCPGNHELYTLPTNKEKGARGEYKYKELLEVARQYGVLTPEDDFVKWEGEGGPAIVAPIFTLYDYSFRPDHVKLEDAVSWAAEENVQATDEALLHPDPYPTRQDWCAALVARTEAKLAETIARNPDVPVIIAGHWPLRQELVSRIEVQVSIGAPRFSNSYFKLKCHRGGTLAWSLGRCLNEKLSSRSIALRFIPTSLDISIQGCRRGGISIQNLKWSQPRERL